MTLQDLHDEPMCQQLRSKSYSTIAQRDKDVRDRLRYRRNQGRVWEFFNVPSRESARPESGPVGQINPGAPTNGSMGPDMPPSRSFFSDLMAIDSFYDLMLDKEVHPVAKRWFGAITILLMFAPLVPILLSCTACRGRLLYPDDHPRNFAGYLIYGKPRLTKLHQCVRGLIYYSKLLAEVCALAMLPLEFFKTYAGELPRWPLTAAVSPYIIAILLQLYLGPIGLFWKLLTFSKEDTLKSRKALV